MRLFAALRRRLDARIARWVRRRQGEDRLPIELRRQRLYVLPSRAGLGFATLLILMLAAGLNYVNSLALLVTFAFAGVALVGVNLCHRNLLGLRILGAVAQPTFCGEPGEIEFTLENPGRVARRAIILQIDATQVVVPCIEPQQTLRVKLLLPTERRGVRRIERVRIATGFPFALATAWSWLHLPLELVVYPRPEGMRAPAASAQGREGGSAVPTAGHDEWVDLRAFRDGDSPRQVAWKAYARGLPLLVKEYRGAAAETLWFDFDTLGPLDTEQRLQQMARWVVDSEARGARYGMQLGRIELATDRGMGHRHNCLAALARHEDAERVPA